MLRSKAFIRLAGRQTTSASRFSRAVRARDTDGGAGSRSKGCGWITRSSEAIAMMWPQVG